MLSSKFAEDRRKERKKQERLDQTMNMYSYEREDFVVLDVDGDRANLRSKLSERGS